ncbi:GNAT family N-acetyltransferase [Roseibium sp.]|uniref:GNAT family N-acetyltransferase n=1 Tax=Roseibium sp. TaxID=1936156 RepID=UPI0039189BAE
MIPSEIRTRRLVLRPPRRDDLNACAALLGDYEVVKMLSRVPYPYDLEGGRAFLDRAAASWKAPEQADELPFHIDHDGQMIGAVGFRKLQETPRIGYWLGQPHWGQGFMSEAVLAALQWLFRTTGHNRVVSEAMKTNAASLAVMNKMGFRQVGESLCDSAARSGPVPALQTELMRADFTTGH